MEKKLTKLRTKIDSSDKLLLKNLKNRFLIVEKISKLKAKQKIKARQNNRFDKMMKERIKQGKKLKLDKLFIGKLFHIIHEESIRIQKRKK